MADDIFGDALGGAGTGASIGSVIPGVGTAIGGIVGGALGIASGLFGKKKANKILAQNPYPTQEMPSEITENQQIARGAATQGMPSEQYEAAQKNIQRNQAAAVSAAQDRRSGVQSIGAIQQASDDATNQLNAQSAEMRRQNRAELYSANQTAASWKDKLFDWNQRQKYIQNYNYGMGLLGQSNQNIMSGADRLLGTAVGAGASGLFGGRGNSPAAASAAPAPYMYTPALANQGGAVNSPAAAGGYLNPYAPSLINT